MIFRFFFSFLFFFFFLFFFSFFFSDSNLVAKKSARQEGVFLVPHLTYLTLPYLHNLRYVNLSNIRYLFTYRTSSQPPLPTSTHRHSGLALLSPLAGSVSPIDQMIQSRRVPSFLSTTFSSQVLLSPALQNKSNSFSSLDPNRIIYGTYGDSFPTLKAKFLNSNSRTRNQK